MFFLRIVFFPPLMLSVLNYRLEWWSDTQAGVRKEISEKPIRQKKIKKIRTFTFFLKVT